MKEIIPIFPLNIVIFPGAKYPLHIFEERYKKMVRASIFSGEGFGIVSKIDLEISNIGCYVLVDKVIKQYDNGSMDIFVEGINRFQIVTKSYNPEGFMEAAVTPFIDAPESQIIDIKDKVMQKFRQIIERTAIELEESFWKKLESTDLKSFKLAEKSGLSIKQQQNILGIQSENERMNYLLEHFNKIEDYLEESKAIRELIAGDGYIN